MSNVQDCYLVVDDDEELRGALRRSLERRGHDVITASDAAGAVKAAQLQSPTRIILDLVIGGDKGIDLIQPLTQHAPAAKIVVLTGYGTVKTAVQAMQRGAYNYLSKPVEVDELLEAFEKRADDSGAEDPPYPTLEEIEREHLQKVLYECQGNVTHAARALKMHRRSLQRKLQKLN